MLTLASYVYSLKSPIFLQTFTFLLCWVCSHPTYCTAVYREWRY